MSKKNNKVYGGYYPANYSKINCVNGHYFPSSVHFSKNKTYSFWERALFQRACSIVDFDLPQEWQGSVRDFFYYCLFRFGYVAIFDSKVRGFTFQPCSLRGVDWYYQFTNALISNPAEKTTIDLKIGEDCEILKLTPDYMGIWPIISHSAEKLSGMDASIDMSIINSRIANILGAKTKAAAESLKKIMDQVSNGNPTVIYDYLLHNDMKDKDSPFQFLDLNVSKNYILDKQIIDMASLLQNFDSEVGIPTLPYSNKRERMVTDEATMKSIDGTSRSRTWKQSVDASLKKVNAKYGKIYTINADFIFLKDDIREVTDNVNGEDNDNRP